ncbi:MAG: hypothetical protein IAG10_00375 [Planctomycetaceae bacterium]|nr:hypothetical protein [Planctomycetaceae bacterium]
MSRFREAVERRRKINESESSAASLAKQAQDEAAVRNRRRQEFDELWELATSPREDIATELRRRQYEQLEKSIINTDGDDVAKHVIRSLIGFDTTARRPDLRIYTNWDDSLDAKALKKRLTIPDKLKISDKLSRQVAACVKQVVKVVPKRDVDRERRRLLRELCTTIEANQWASLVDQLPDNDAQAVLIGILEGDITDDELDELLLRNQRTWFQFRDLKDSLLSRIKRTEEKTEAVVAKHQADDLKHVPSGSPETPAAENSASVATKTLRKHRETAHADGQFGPDGFYLDGILVTGLTDNELALLKLALDKQPDGPTEDDVCNMTEFKSWTRERLDKLLGTIKAKFLTATCPRVLRWANRHLVFREPRQRAKAAPRFVAKTNGGKAGRTRGETLQKDGRHKRR